MLKTLQVAARKVAGKLGRQSWIVRQLRPAYAKFLEVLAHGHGIPWEINGVNFRIDPRMRQQMGNDYDPHVAKFLCDRVHPDDVIINVGANVGVYVLQFAHWSAPRGCVVAFEPNSAAREVLQKHVEWNGLIDRVRIEPFAVSDQEGEATLHVSGTDVMSRLGTPNPSLAGKTRAVSVDVTTLDRYVEKSGVVPNWVFIDIEGFELAALGAARGLVRNTAAEFIVELHPEMWGAAGTSRQEAVELFESLGVSAEPLSGQQAPLDDYGIVWLKRKGC